MEWKRCWLGTLDTNEQLILQTSNTCEACSHGCWWVLLDLLTGVKGILHGQDVTVPTKPACLPASGSARLLRP